MVKLYSTFDPRPSVHEKLSSKSKTETAGYIPADKQITNLIQSGLRLSEFRKAEYDTVDSKADLNIDPTRKPGLDLADATQIARQAAINIATQAAAVPKTPVSAPTTLVVVPPPVVTPPPAGG